MKDAKRFYESRAWKNCRKAYAASVGGLCEICLKSGIYKPGEIVHHKRHISPETINDPEVLLDWKNLLFVCRDHHGELHSGRRYTIDEYGRVIPR